MREQAGDVGDRLDKILNQHTRRAEAEKKSSEEAIARITAKRAAATAALRDVVLPATKPLVERLNQAGLSADIVFSDHGPDGPGVTLRFGPGKTGQFTHVLWFRVNPSNEIDVERIPEVRTALEKVIDQATVMTRPPLSIDEKWVTDHVLAFVDGVLNWEK